MQSGMGHEMRSGVTGPFIPVGMSFSMFFSI